MLTGTAFGQQGQTTPTNLPDKGQVSVASAKAGDHFALQYFACRVETANVLEMESLMQEDIDRIGGDFAITLYRRLLDSDPRFVPQLEELQKLEESRKPPPMDIALPERPSIAVLSRLSTLLPDAGIPKSPLLDYALPYEDFGLRAKWRAWIDSHEAEIRKLKPTAEGLSFEPGACPATGSKNRRSRQRRHAH